MTDYTHRRAPFPKIAAVLGASTDVGQLLLRELLQSPEIEKVHAIANHDIPLLSQLRSQDLRKARIHLLHFDDLEKAFARIAECDLAFCVSMTDRHAYEKIGLKSFRLANRTAPIRFIDKMFDLGVVHISLLSHPSADSDSRSEFNQCRGEVEDYLRVQRREAGDYAPYIATLKISTPVHSAGATRSSRDHLKSKASDSESRSQPIEVREVVRAMQVDSYMKAAVKRPPGSKKKLTSNEEFYATDILRLLRNERSGNSGQY